MPGLLAAFMDPSPDEEAFNAWYDEEHAPMRLTVPGFLTARRYAAAEADGPRYLALYDLESIDVLRSADYQRLHAEASPREREIMAAIPMIDRRELELVLDCPAWSDAPPFQLIVCMTPAAGGEDDFVAWYREEHIAMLLEVPGWRRARLFRQVAGQGPAFMAAHELERPDVFDEPAYAAAVGTPWRRRIRESVQRFERNLFRHWRTFR